ncbi:MAG: hypothetical protein J6K53_00250 [Roseburia sp.]|nr:hypothetical protein [Roseburia sp.]
MQKGTIKAAVLLIIFIIAVLVFGKLTNHTNEDLTTEMEEATLPVISLYQDGRELNELHGYATEMNAAYMRDTITPIGEDWKLPIAIQTYQTAVDTISYEIRSLDAERLIANADVSSYEEKHGKITAELQIQNLLETGEEYLLIIRLESGDKPIYYYTRIMQPKDCYVSECVDFALDFHDKTFNDETTGSLATYMEKTTGDNSTLHFVSLNSSLKQVGWANFKGEELTAPIPSIKEITSTYNVIVLQYVVSSVGESGQIEYYNVEEYYRVRYTASRVYLLNFERTMNQIFRGENDSVYEQYIQLGIRSGEVEYKTNEAASSIAFVQEGELWCYNTVENTLAKVFGFRGYEGIDSRENYGEHEIKIVGIDEAGSVDYIVYGYMNRGIHEGEVGIAVYHYDSLSNTNEEFVFIPSDKSYEIMKSELGQLMYVNEGGELFLMVDGTIYGIDLNTLKTRELVKGLADEAFAVSGSDRYIAWIDTADSARGSDTIHVMNLSSQKSVEIKGAAGEALKPLGFMGEDFVYGIAKEADIFEDAAGNVTFPMYQIKILDVSSEELKELKTYEKSGYYVAGVDIDDYTMHLRRIQYNGTAYVSADEDMIMNREGDTGRLVTIATSVSEEKETQVQLTLAGTASEKTPRLLTPKETILEEERTVVLKDESSTRHYYVYVKGDVVLATDNVTEAVIAANENMGVVIGDNLEYVWKRSRNATQPAPSEIVVGAEDAGAGSIAQCINAMLEIEGINISVSALIEGGETPKSILNNTMKDAQVLDLTGCSVDEILYYVSCGSPVFAMTESDQAVLVVGYDSSSVVIYDPMIQSTYRRNLSDAGDMFANAGNVFFTYISK